MAKIYFSLAVMTYVCATVMLFTALVTDDWLEEEDPSTLYGTKVKQGKTSTEWTLMGIACGISSFGFIALFYHVYYRGVAWVRIFYMLCSASSGALSLAAVLVFRSNYPVDATSEYGFGFNTAVAATALAWATNVMLLIHYFLTKNESKLATHLSSRQKLVVLSFACLFIYVHVGAVVFAALEPDWKGADALQFALVTAASVGYGTPDNGVPPGIPYHTGSRVFVFFWFPVGFILVAWFGKTAWDAFATTVNTAVEERRLKRHESYLSHNQLYENKIVSLSRKILFGSLFGLITWFVGAAIFMATENWTYFEGLWFCYQSIFTIGYGDIVPQSKRVYLLFFFLLFGLGSVAFLISAIAGVYIAAIEKKVQDEVKKDQVLVMNAVTDFQKATFGILSKFSAEDAEVYDTAWKKLLTEVNVETNDIPSSSPTKLLFQQLLTFSMRPPQRNTTASTATSASVATSGRPTQQGNEMLHLSITSNSQQNDPSQPMESPAANSRRLSSSARPTVSSTRP